MVGMIEREVKINLVSAAGVSLEVVFRNLGFIYGYEIKTSFATTSSGQDHIRYTSMYFSTIEKAKQWITELTEEIVAIKKKQMKMAKDFEDALARTDEIVIP